MLFHGDFFNRIYPEDVLNELNSARTVPTHNAYLLIDSPQGEQVFLSWFVKFLSESNNNSPTQSMAMELVQPSSAVPPESIPISPFYLFVRSLVSLDGYFYFHLASLFTTTSNYSVDPSDIYLLLLFFSSFFFNQFYTFVDRHCHNLFDILYNRYGVLISGSEQRHLSYAGTELLTTLIGCPPGLFLDVLTSHGYNQHFLFTLEEFKEVYLSISIAVCDSSIQRVTCGAPLAAAPKSSCSVS